MITCPLCQKTLLQYPLNGNYNLSIDYPDDFHCATNIKVSEDHVWCHFDRSTIRNNYIEYIAIVPPFRITWVEDRNHLLVEQFSITKSGKINLTFTYSKENALFQNFINTCQRFEKLRVFS